jgi:Nif-specific regulatory protein
MAARDQPPPLDDVAARASALDRVALRITSTLDVEDVLDAVTSGLVEELDVALARVWLADAGEDGEKALYLRASSGLSRRLDGAYRRVPIGALKIGQIAATEEPVWTNDVGRDPRIADPAWAAANDLVSFAGWPMTFRGELLGVLAVFARRPWSDAERARLALFANQAAIAIKNARLFAEVEALTLRLKADNAYLRRQAEEAEDALDRVQRTPGLSSIVEPLRSVAATTTTVLLVGETGTGKELLARAVHEASPRRAKPMVRVNCAALSPSLVESELFGHEKGAFTGASARRLGRFELAHGGTLLLDEVGEVPLEIQPKLLRVLQERELERVGGHRTVRVDVRIVAATNRDLAAEVRAGRFRADLYYRLAVFPLRVPPLRERREDILCLAAAFVEEQARRLGRAVGPLTPAARERLERYDWPGNVRELYNVIERAAIVARGSITEDDLVSLAAGVAASSVAPAASVQTPEGGGDAADATLVSVERAHVLRVLERAGWIIEGKAGAAAILGLAPSTLRSRMSQLDIRRPRG